MKHVLHVGSGPKNARALPEFYPSPEWRETRLDIDPNVRPDIVGDIRNMPQIRSESFDAVYSSHNLEHLYPHEAPLALAEFFRALKPGGHVRVNCPDLQAIAALVARGVLLEPVYISPAGPIAPFDMLFGHRPSLAGGRAHMAHHTGFTDQSLALALREAGFENLRVQRRGEPHFDLLALGFRPAPG